MASKTKWRVKRVRIQLTRTNIIIVSLRKFRTARSSRSKKFSQYVWEINIFGIREVVIRSKTLRKKNNQNLQKQVSYILIMVGLLGVLHFSQLLSLQQSEATPPISFNIPTPESKTNENVKPTKLSKSEPVFLEIPSINISAPVGQVGQLADGTMETPNLQDNNLAGWYKFSPTPGETGPSVIVGHVGNKKGPSVFWNVGKLKLGDLIEIKRADNTTTTFSVSGVSQYDKSSFPSEKIYGDIDFAGLRLITCGGVFDKQTGEYPANTIVYASFVQ